MATTAQNSTFGQSSCTSISSRMISAASHASSSSATAAADAATPAATNPPLSSQSPSSLFPNNDREDVNANANADEDVESSDSTPEIRMQSFSSLRWIDEIERTSRAHSNNNAVQEEEEEEEESDNRKGGKRKVRGIWRRFRRRSNLNSADGNGNGSGSGKERRKLLWKRGKLEVIHGVEVECDLVKRWTRLCVL